MEDCLFCKIIKKKWIQKLYMKIATFLFLWINFLIRPGHMLIVPKIHISDLIEISDDYFVKFNNVLKLMVDLVVSKLGADGVSVTVNYGNCQYIKHYHMHVIPRYNEKNNLSNERKYTKFL